MRLSRDARQKAEGRSSAIYPIVSFGRSAGSTAPLSATTAITAVLALPSFTLANPTGGVVVDGAATISSTTNVTNVIQSTNRAIINWRGFSIGAGETINFLQPTAMSVTLNRVVSNEQSVISGALNANGRVFLVNSTGILFSKDAQVNVGGLVASTLDISNANFISVALASGEQMTLNFEDDSLVDVTIDKGTYDALVLTKTNIPTPDPSNANNTLVIGKARSQGVEIDVTGEVRRRMAARCSRAAVAGGVPDRWRDGGMCLAGTAFGKSRSVSQITRFL